MALRIFAPLIALVGVGLSAPTYSVPLAYVALTPIPENIYNQVQDTKSGEYAFGYAGGPVAREESKTSDGVVRGAYSYVDAHGIVQYYRYIADDDGFRVVGTNIPTETAPSVQSQLQEHLRTNAENSPDKSEEGFSSRRKRSALYYAFERAEAIPAAPLTVAAAASVPTATSSQSRVQFHNNLKAEIGQPVETIASEHIVTVPEVEIAVRSADEIPIAVAASVPTSTSSQFRHQVHSSAKTELHAPVQVISAKTTAGGPAASVAIPVKFQSAEAIPVAVAASVPTSTSSQSRYQVHNSGKIEFHSSGEAVPVQAIPAVAATSIGSENAEAASVTVAAAAPISTSSQSRFQIHSTVKTEVHEPIDTIPIETVATVPATPLAAVASLPVATSSQRRFQNHDSSQALPALATVSTSYHSSAQGISNAGLGYGESSQSAKYELINLEPVNGLQLANAFSVPSLARHQVGVGLGVVPSPLVAYHTLDSPLYA